LATASVPTQEQEPFAVVPRKKSVRLTLWPLVAATFFAAMRLDPEDLQLSAAAQQANVEAVRAKYIQVKADETRWSHLALLHPRAMNSTPPITHYDHLSVRRSRFRSGDFIIHFWPLARQRNAVLDMMIKYDALSKERRK